jgi:hypothetical protein
MDEVCVEPGTIKPAFAAATNSGLGATPTASTTATISWRSVALVEWTANKSMMFIRANGGVINSVSNDGPHTSDLRHLKTSSYAVGQQVRSQSFALVLSIDG